MPRLEMCGRHALRRDFVSQINYVDFVDFEDSAGEPARELQRFMWASDGPYAGSNATNTRIIGISYNFADLILNFTRTHFPKWQIQQVDYRLCDVLRDSPCTDNVRLEIGDEQALNRRRLGLQLRNPYPLIHKQP